MKFRHWMNVALLSLVAIICGFLIIIFLLHYDNDFKNVVEKQVKTVFLYAFKSHLEGTVKRINIFTGEIELENVVVVPEHHDGTWSWQARQFIIQFSWLSYVARGKFDVLVNLDELVSHSQVINSYPIIIDHLKNFIAGAEGFPATLKSLAISRGDFTLSDNARKMTLKTLFNGSYGNVQGILYLHCATEHGDIFIETHKIIEGLSASFHCSISDLKNCTIDAVINGSLQLLQRPLGKHICSFDGQWHKQQGQLFLHTSDSKYSLSLYNWQKNEQKVSGDFSCALPLSYCASFVPALQPFALQGEAYCQMHVTLDDDYKIIGEMIAQDVALCGKEIGTFQGKGELIDGIIEATGSHLSDNQIDDSFKARVYYNGLTDKGNALIQIMPQEPLQLPFALKMLEGSCSVTLQNRLLTGSYHGQCVHDALKDVFAVKGDFIYDTHQFTLHGDCGSKKIDMNCGINPLHLNECKIYEKNETSLLNVQQTQDSIKGIIDVQLLKEFGATFFNYKIPGQGVFELDALYASDKSIKTQLVLKEGNIRVPGTYTLVRSLKGTCNLDYGNTLLEITDGVIELDKGHIECKRGIIRFDEQGTIQSAYLPIVLKKAFLTLHKDVLAVVSGYLLFIMQGTQNPLLKGSLNIDRSYCKKNIFSQLGGANSAGLPFVTHMLSPDYKDLLVDLTLETKKPLEVKTSFLETQVQMDLALNGSLQNPQLAGAINLVQGILSFPYKPLNITHGMIYFLPHQMYDPTIELIAKGKIRKYQVTLRCNGSLQHPAISFESTPPLTEEQIITLLLAGTEEGSLSLAMPALVAQKLQNVIFGPEQSALKLEGYFKSLIEPLKHIRFIPGFSDQSGRGGFRGSIEIDVNDQLRAMIQKNFSLTEDIKFEVEYFFSDDITFRGIRDERADFGGEVEMRWKF